MKRKRKRGNFVTVVVIAFFVASLTSSSGVVVANDHKLNGGDVSSPSSLEPSKDRKLEELTGVLEKMIGHKDNEAKLLARTALDTAQKLAKDYQLVSPALFHNFLVSIGLREKGLCCHWTEDLLTALTQLNLKKFQLGWAVNNYDTIDEHNSVIVFVPGQHFDMALLLDPWRYSGDLYWKEIRNDDYLWRPHPKFSGLGTVVCR